MDSLAELACLDERPIYFTKHADRRIGERLRESDLDSVARRIAELIEQGHVEHRAKRIFYVHAAEGFYVVAIYPDRAVVITICTVKREDVAA